MSKKHDFQFKRWQSLIRECKESGLTIRAWCAANDISRQQYYYWLKKVQEKYYDVAIKQIEITDESCTAVTPIGSHVSSFVELSPDIVNETTNQVNSEQSVINLSPTHLPSAVIKKDGFRIEIMPNASASFIRQLITAVNYA